VLNISAWYLCLLFIPDVCAGSYPHEHSHVPGNAAQEGLLVKESSNVVGSIHIVDNEKHKDLIV
jgi:hypothetical protein